MSNTSDTPNQLPSQAQVQIALGPYSIASIKTWLKSKKLPFSATSRTDSAKRVHQLLEKGKLDFDELLAALIGIEESASKHVYLYSAECDGQIAKALEKQLRDLKIPLSASRLPASSLTKTPKLIYALNTQKEFRAKWAEVQTRVTLDMKTLDPKKTPLPRVVVFVFDKQTERFNCGMTHRYSSIMARASQYNKNPRTSTSRRFQSPDSIGAMQGHSPAPETHAPKTRKSLIKGHVQFL